MCNDLACLCQGYDTLDFMDEFMNVFEYNYTLEEEARIHQRLGLHREEGSPE